MDRKSVLGLGSRDQMTGAAAMTASADGGAPPIAFPQGLPGFPTATRFALLPLREAGDGLLVMQSEDDPDLRFLVLPYREQELPLRRDDLDAACELLGVRSEHAAVLLVVTRRPTAHEAGGAGQLFVNLRAPVVVDTERRTAVQHVLASQGYSVRHPLAAAA
jgi:flagellar assembly factor FliW